MNYSRHLGLPALVACAGLMAGCFDEERDSGNNSTGGNGCVDKDNVLALEISKDCELDAGSSYSLKGLTFVKEGVTLTIGAGARISGKEDGSLSALIVQPGAYLKALGTKDAPIVFTAGTSDPERGDFGGVVLLGDADINLANETGDVEGLTGVPFGGNDNADSSGELRYVRIEYAGHLLGTDNELNGLTMAGVGSKTKISHVQVYEGLDDCFEWFGGTVSASHLVASGCDDDMFDWDMGWTGTLQFALGVHTATTNTDANGIEADNLNNNEDNTPRSAPKVANLTLIGNGASSLNGMRLRRGTGGQIVNAIVTGFAKGAAVRVDGNSSIGLVNDGGLKGEAIYVYGNGKEINVAAAAGLGDSAATVAKTSSEIGKWFTSENAALGLTWKSPKPAASPSGAVDAPSGMETAKYLGAFDPSASTLWTDGWTIAEDGPAPVTSCLETGNVLKASIEEDCNLAGDRTYHLAGLTFVKDGATLTIGAGATVKGKSDGSLSALVVQPGARLHAVGTSTKPIVFTAGTSEPERGDIGGLVILGKADINLANETGDIEGLVGVPFGGTSDDDSSGVLQYVRIEYAGHLLGTDNELNGLTMGGVGSKTKISHVQVYEGLDDCFEWFGGTVSARYLAATGCDDDMFDWDMGWRGTLQFAVGGHTEITNTDANGIEADNLNNNEGNTPRSAPKVSNLTLIGNGKSSLNGMRLRRGTGGHIVNAIVTGFAKGAAVRIDGNTSIGLVNDGGLKVDALYAYANGKKTTVSAAAGLADSAVTVAATLTKLDGWFLADTASLGVTLASPKPDSAAVSGAVDVPSGFMAAKYLGAFDPSATALWTDGWIRGD
jgi:hypothetical protein